MTIERKVLLEALKLVMPGIESGNVVLQGSDSFVFHEGKLFTYNDSIAVVVPVESVGLVDEGLEGAVHAKEFFNVISKFTNDEITFSTTEDGKWMLKCGRAKVEMTLLDFDWRTRLDGVTPDSNNWVDLPENFSNALASCRMLGNKTAMSGLYVRDNHVISTDGFQINLFNLKCELPKFWISDNSLGELLKLTNLKKVEVGTNWVHFEANDGVVFSIKTLNDEKYPYEKVMGLMNKSKPKEGDFNSTFPKSLFPAIERADNFAIDVSDKALIKLTFNKEDIEVLAERSSGKYVENVAWDSPIEIDKPIVVYINATMMIAMSQHSLNFYVLNQMNKNGTGIVPRLLFVSEDSSHLMGTFSV